MESNIEDFELNLGKVKGSLFLNNEVKEVLKKSWRITVTQQFASEPLRRKNLAKEQHRLNAKLLELYVANPLMPKKVRIRAEKTIKHLLSLAAGKRSRYKITLNENQYFTPK